MINTREKLRQYIKEELGYPQLNVELTDNQIDHNIDKAIQMFANVAFDGELTKYIKFDCQGMGEYIVNEQIEEITQVNQSGLFYSGQDFGGFVDQNLSNFILNSSTGASLSYLVTLSSYRTLSSQFFGNSVAFEFNSHKSTLTIFQNHFGPLLIEAKFRYEPDDIDKIYNQEWVKKMSVAQSRLMQSTILGKYSQNLINGAQVNYSDMRSLAQDEIQALKEELEEKWQDMPPMFIG